MIFFSLIDDLQLLAEAANEPRTEQQLMNHGLEIIQRTGDMEKGLSEWFEMNPANKNWDNFKTHFSNAHRTLKQIRGKAIQNTAFQQANSLVQSVNANLEDIRSEINSLALSRANTPPPEASTLTPPSDPSMNSITTNDLLNLLIKLTQQLNTTSEPSIAQPRKPRSTFVRNRTDHYCWTHGACGHNSNNCRNKKEGHRNDATFEDKMGGNTFLCKEANKSRKSDGTI